MSLPKRVAFLGASISEGFSDFESGGFVALFKKWLQQIHQHSYVYNLGISGENSTQILKRAIPELMPRRPELVVVQICSNDFARFESKEEDPKVSLVQMEDNFYTLISQIQLSSQVICLGPPPVDESKTSPVSWKNVYFFNHDVERYNQKAIEICQSLGVDFIDLYSQWREQNYQSLLADGLHPNSQGHQYIFERLKEVVKRG